MTEIEVLRVPDERLESWMVRSLTVPALRLLDGSVVAVQEGDLVVVSHSGVEDEWSDFAYRTTFSRESVSALLAALMEDAGAVKVGYFRDQDGIHVVSAGPVFPEGVTTWTGRLLPDKETGI